MKASPVLVGPWIIDGPATIADSVLNMVTLLGIYARALALDLALTRLWPCSAAPLPISVSPLPQPLRSSSLTSTSSDHPIIT
jgi:hypothetical protein